MKRFKYNGTVYETPNIEKKLKRMKISIDDIEILEDAQEIVITDDNTPQWVIDGYVKHKWINNDPNSKEYKWSIIGFHKLNEQVVFSNQRGWDPDKVTYIDNIVWQE